MKQITENHPSEENDAQVRIGLTVNGYSFEWMGRNRQGVSRWKGNTSGPPAVMGKILKTYGMIAGIVGVILAILAPVLHLREAVAFPLITVGIVHGIVFSLLGAWITRIRWQISALKQPDEICETLGIPGEELHERAAERGVKPQMIINDRPLYNLADFSDAHSLLRGSSAPVSPDTLLRAAIADTRETPADQLLRASADGHKNEETIAARWREPAMSEQESQEQVHNKQA